MEYKLTKLSFMQCKKGESSRIQTPSELNRSRLFIILLHQNLYFQQLKCLLRKKVLLPKKSFHPYLKLNPTFDGELFRVGGRLANSQLPNDNKHPLLLYDKDVFSRLLADQAH